MFGSGIVEGSEVYGDAALMRLQHEAVGIGHIPQVVTALNVYACDEQWRTVATTFDETVGGKYGTIGESYEPPSSWQRQRMGIAEAQVAFAEEAAVQHTVARGWVCSKGMVCVEGLEGQQRHDVPSHNHEVLV